MDMSPNLTDGKASGTSDDLIVTYLRYINLEGTAWQVNYPGTKWGRVVLAAK